jgi:hypothetical protein
MRSDLLQQLRDIHVPAPPGWWPPAPGWWLVAMLALVVVILLARTAWHAWTRRRPIRRTRELHAVLVRQLEDGTFAGATYAHACNELLKRLFVHGLGIDAARRLADDRWLAMLDRALGAPEFSQGAGRALGNTRFARAPEIDTDALVRVVERLLATITPRTAALVAGKQGLDEPSVALEQLTPGPASYGQGSQQRTASQERAA